MYSGINRIAFIFELKDVSVLLSYPRFLLPECLDPFFFILHPAVITCEARRPFLQMRPLPHNL